MSPSKDYLALLNAGPFSGRVDPWAEKDDYFHQLHAGIIGEIIKTIRTPLEALGYYASREASLQIVDEASRPDVAVLHNTIPDHFSPRWDYGAAAAQAQAEPGVISAVDEPALDTIYIYREPAQLVSIIEIISPRNKDRPEACLNYMVKRESFVRERGVNVLEIDLTRSIQRLLNDELVRANAYHAAVFIPGEITRIVEMPFDAPLKRIAIPLRQEVVPVDMQAIYDTAYYDHFIARQILSRGDYVESELPFPSTLTETQRQVCKDTLQRWQSALEKLQSPNTN